MGKTGLWAATSLVVLIGVHETQAQTPIPPSPTDFLMAASQSDQYEIFAAGAAMAQGQDPHVRTFAEEMLRDHTKLAEDLRRAAVASGYPPPRFGMSSDQARLLSSLQSVQGPEFDRIYARQQELTHAQAMAVDESFATSGSDPNLQRAARSALSTVQDHLKMARRLQADLGGS